MTVATWWEELTAAALLGAARRPPPALPEEFGVRPRTGSDPATALLDAAAVGGLAQRAGRAAEARDAPEAAPAEALPEAPARAVQLLELALHQSPAGRELRGPLVREWLDAAANAGTRLPHRLLPAVLDLATSDVRLRDALPPVAGSRGAWLAGHHPGWSWWGGPETPSAADWHTLPTSQRIELLRTLRTTDTDRARELIASTWATDAAAERKTHLEALAVGLGPADEPFLEAALDDRAKGVREVALTLLERLPSSRRATRMAERLAPLLHVSKRLLSRSLTVELPPDADAAGVRDGLSKAGAGARGRNLALLVSAAPLSVWTNTTGLRPAEVVDLLQAHELRPAVERAVLLQRDPAWVQAFAEHGTVAMLVHLDPALRARLAPKLISHVGAGPDALRTLADLDGPWDADTSAAMLTMITARLAKTALREHLTTLAARLHPASVTALQRLAASDRPDAPAAGHLVQFLTLRHTIREAFA